MQSSIILKIRLFPLFFVFCFDYMLIFLVSLLCFGSSFLVLSIYDMSFFLSFYYLVYVIRSFDKTKEAKSFICIQFIFLE
jgi:hypothetical protein